jgi:hypothetical protein
VELFTNVCRACLKGEADAKVSIEGFSLEGKDKQVEITVGEVQIQITPKQELK